MYLPQSILQEETHLKSKICKNNPLNHVTHYSSSTKALQTNSLMYELEVAKEYIRRSANRNMLQSQTSQSQQDMFIPIQLFYYCMKRR